LRILSGGVEIGKVWADVRPPLEVGEQKGLREEGRTKIVVRPRPDLRPGLILDGPAGLFVVEGLGDRLARGQEVHLSCTRLVGRPGMDRQRSGAEWPVRVFVRINTPYIGLSGQLMDYRYRLEIPSFERPGPWQPGDAIVVDGGEYPLTGLAEEGDDGTVTAY